MNWIKQINEALDYIEVHLFEEIDLEKLALRHYTSYYHFHKVFSIICGVSLSEYIRNRRLSLSSNMIKQKNTTILDVAIKCGYNTHESFTKSFKKFHGITPSDAKKEDVVLSYYPKKSFQINIEGELKMEYKISKKGPLYFLGKMVKVVGGKGELKSRIPQLWKDTMDNGGYNILKEHSIINRPTTLVYDIYPSIDKVSYLIGVMTRELVDLEGYVSVEIPETLYVQFYSEAEDLETLHKLKKDIYTNWVSDQPYEFIPVAEVELYYEKNTKDKTGKFEYWISINKKTS